jgi:hypothetical protein
MSSLGIKKPPPEQGQKQASGFGLAQTTPEKKTAREESDANHRSDGAERGAASVGQDHRGGKGGGAHNPHRLLPMAYSCGFLHSSAAPL